ncbi:uncharacterized protein CFP56_026060 [Quercus suber]|uniref:DUF4283 domain-containing protein n=1 Tax=Quercus suber TaxID=58331 RepID=A0AAW0K110_QUESU
MADDVINSLENMKLTTDEEEVIEIADEGRKDEIESCTLSLIGKFLTCKSFNKRAAISTLKKAWGLEDRVQFVEVGSNLFQFKFKEEFDMERICRSGPWTFDNQALMLIRWKKGLTARNVKFDSVALWVQIWGAPFDMISPNVATAVGSKIGTVEDVEKKQKHEARNIFMRVRVSIPISKPIRRGGFIAGSDGVRSWVNFKYERLPFFCHYCGILGHDTKHCASYYAASKNEGEVVCPYGDWLKAGGVRSTSPVKRSSSYSASGSKNRGPDKVCDNTGEVMQSPAAQGKVTANPKGDDGYVKETIASMETAPKSKGFNAVQEGRDMSVTDTRDMNHGKLNSEILNSNGEEKEADTPVGHVTENVQVGLGT